jgi:enolase
MVTWKPSIQENKEGLELLKIAIEKAGYTGKVSSCPLHLECEYVSIFLTVPIS